MAYMNPNSPGKRQRLSDWIQKKHSHMSFIRDISKYEDKEMDRVKVWERFARQMLTQKR